MTNQAGGITKTLGKQFLHGCFGSYQYWKVLYIDLPQPPVALPEHVTVREVVNDELLQSSDEGFRSRVVFGGPGAQGFGLFVGDELATIQWYWWPDRHWEERQGRSWRLPPGCVKSVGLYTAPAFRGHGYAQLIKRYTAHVMSQRGCVRVYSRIWHSHRASIAVSRKAGWRTAGSYVELAPLGYRFSFRLPL